MAPVRENIGKRRFGVELGCPRFNPHPPFLAGEFHQLLDNEVHANVSIHTRYFWRVNWVDGCIHGAGVQVSIHTRHFWRVNLGPLRGYTSLTMFQPKSGS